MSTLNRDAVIAAALELLDTLGMEGLSMRSVADRLGVRAASLYWHLRDKEQLFEALSEAILDRVELPTAPMPWRAQVIAACDELAGLLRGHRAAAEVLLHCMATVQRSRLVRDLTRVLAATGLADAETAAFSLVVEAVANGYVVPPRRAPAEGGPKRTLAVDSGSYRVAVRAAAHGAAEPVTSVGGGGGAASIEARPDGVFVVRNRRGANRGAVELDPAFQWQIKVHGGTWNTVLDLRDLHVTGVELDSGAGNVTCTLPAPVGAVPIRVNSGIVGASFRRPRGTALRATVSSGSVRVRIDDRALRPSATDQVVDSAGTPAGADRYEFTVCSGCMKVTMDASAEAGREPVVAVVSGGPADAATTPPATGVDLLLDGIEARLARSPA